MEGLDRYLDSEFLPYVRAIYATNVKTFISVKEVFHLVMQAVEKLQLKKDQVSKLNKCK